MFYLSSLDHIAERYLSAACEHSTVIDQTIDKFGDVCLASYIELVTSVGNDSYQASDDLLDVVYRYAFPLLGESVARQLSVDLNICPIVLTANHHGIDFFAQSVQGNLLFSLKNIVAGKKTNTIPIFSCGSIPLNNLTYPRGLLIYHLISEQLVDIPAKLPLFPERMKHDLVSTTTSFNELMIRRVEKRLCMMTKNGEISSTFAASLQYILREDFLADSVINQSNYSKQSTVLNNRIWKRLFNKNLSTQDLVYLEIEKIVNMLLELDLRNIDSLAWRVIFDISLREIILEQLDGVRVCWQREKLHKRFSFKRQQNNQPFTREAGSGTVFFWSINSTGKRVPLIIKSSHLKHEILTGIDDKGEVSEIPLTPEFIIQGLRKKQLLPSLFTCFLVLSFARGLICTGGYYQAEYLPLMQQGLVNAFEKSGDYQTAKLISKVHTDNYLSGMQTIMCRLEDRALVPAGPLEIIAGGGLTSEDLEQMLSLTVREAHLASLSETIPDLAPNVLSEPEWKKQLAHDCDTLLTGKVVVKDVDKKYRTMVT